MCKISWAAEGLAYTCYAMYAENRHGLGPEDVQFKSNESKNWGKVLKVSCLVLTSASESCHETHVVKRGEVMMTQWVCASCHDASHVRRLARSTFAHSST